MVKVAVKSGKENWATTELSLSNSLVTSMMFMLNVSTSSGAQRPSLSLAEPFNRVPARLLLPLSNRLTDQLNIVVPHYTLDCSAILPYRYYTIIYPTIIILTTTFFILHWIFQPSYLIIHPIIHPTTSYTGLFITLTHPSPTTVGIKGVPPYHYNVKSPPLLHSPCCSSY